MKIKHLGMLLVSLLTLMSVLFVAALGRAIQQFEESTLSIKTSYQNIALPLEQMDANTKNLRFHLYASFMHDERQSVSHYHTHPLSAHTDAIKAAIKGNEGLWRTLTENKDSNALGIDLQPLKSIYDAYYIKGIEPGIRAAESKDWDSIVKTVTGSLAEYGAFEKAMAEQLKLMNEVQENSVEAVRIQQRRLLMGLSIVAGLLMLVSVLLVWRTISRLSRRLQSAIGVIDAMVEGDLSDVNVDTGHDEAAEMLQAVSKMQVHFKDMINSVRSGAESVAMASVQIARGNADLSQRTEEQAGALEETSATMEQLGSTVSNNTDNARQADQLAQAAAGVALQGGEVVGEVVGTMQGISESSRKIGDIIGVIDGIAFQTNILALNAAVEAARAGEQGRGFAVVAGEVRTLAQRSAEAAKEIKSLISRNVEQVEQGATLVERAGKTMDEIVGSIKRVSDIVAEISSATIEQRTGVQQVGDAVGRMDQVTQQNAALVEESAAAAESLRMQAQQLLQAVSFFKTGGRVDSAQVSEKLIQLT